MGPWFSSFPLNPFVRRAKRRIPIRMNKLIRSTNDALMCFGSGRISPALIFLVN